MSENGKIMLFRVQRIQSPIS